MHVCDWFMRCWALSFLAHSFHHFIHRLDAFLFLHWRSAADLLTDHSLGFGFSIKLTNCCFFRLHPIKEGDLVSTRKIPFPWMKCQKRFQVSITEPFGLKFLTKIKLICFIFWNKLVGILHCSNCYLWNLKWSISWSINTKTTLFKKACVQLYSADLNITKAEQWFIKSPTMLCITLLLTKERLF